MKKRDAIEHFGSAAKMAQILGITPQAVGQWPEDVPVGRAYQLQVITGGQLLVDTSSKKECAASS